MSYDIQGNYNLIENFIPFGFGDKGSKGVRGDEGEIGKIGNRGQLGISGEKGDQGMTGPRGDLGPRGPKGIKGEPGPKGKNGLRGDRGEEGPRGSKGDVGPKGDDGPKGFLGPFGARGDLGIKGDIGEQGEAGYKGLVNINYGKCIYTNWTEYFKNTEIKCPDNSIGISIDTECKCENRDNARIYKNNRKEDRENCGILTKRDCRHRILCCPLQLNDIPEPVTVLDNRYFSGTIDPDVKEKLINKLWIKLKPQSLNKTIDDYPINIFSTDESDNLKTEDKDEKIPYTSDCKSKFCLLEGQLCTDNKVCLNKVNLETKCYKPPCWHNILKEKTDCDHKCEYEELGSLCGNKICDMRKNDKCDNPPCWNNIPLLEKCKGVRCPTKGQQCALGGEKFNLVGFECKDEKNLNPNNNRYEQCLNPPCWHKAEQYTLDCSDPSCRIIGQKCGSNDEYTKICLNKKNVNCNNPPCWHDVETSQCNDLLRDDAQDTLCIREALKDVNGNDILDKDGNQILVLKDCDYAGNCSKIGSRCLIDNEIKFECMNTKKSMDTNSKNNPSYKFNKKKCNNPPCWVPVTDGIDNQVYMQLKVINDKNFKSDNDILSLETLKKNSLEDNTYEFTEEDRKGTIDFNTFYNFMNDNWSIFEANCKLQNAQFIWNKYVGLNNRMDYYQFNGVMRILKVEKFKYRNEVGRIFPQAMDYNDYNQIYNYYDKITQN
tara:strand:+ start:3352 stop:5493 length:2142 start_codon:yes stop_codon:yes gene_type:complete